jgi:hypothetical protein
MKFAPKNSLPLALADGIMDRKTKNFSPNVSALYWAKAQNLVLF